MASRSYEETDPLFERGKEDGEKRLLLKPLIQDSILSRRRSVKRTAAERTRAEIVI